MTYARPHPPLRLASTLTAIALGVVGVALSSSPGGAPSEANEILGQTVSATLPESHSATTVEQAEAQTFVLLINDLRKEEGLTPLTSDPELELTAVAWATRMSQTGDLSHAEDLALGVSGDWRKLGENVGVSPAGQLEELFEAFVNSPSHRANMVDPSFDTVGIGVVHVDDKVWMTQRFMDASPEELGVELG